MTGTVKAWCGKKEQDQQILMLAALCEQSAVMQAACKHNQRQCVASKPKDLNSYLIPPLLQ